MESKLDYLTLTLKPENPFLTYTDALKVLSDTLLLGDLIGKMTLKGRFAFYDAHLSYENIHLLLSEPEHFSEQGLCLRISGQGLVYFVRYLDSYGFTLQKWLHEWRGLCFNGYVTKCTRFDYAMDDVCFNGDKPVITLRKLLACKRNREICKKGRVLDVVNGDDLSTRERTKFINGEEIKGTTFYVGSRESNFVIRFYDKLAEQLQQRLEVPDGCTSWTRCELELKGNDSMSAFNAFLDMPDDGFAEYMRGVLNDHCRFISRTDSNISRCPVKRWWREFLQGCTSCFKLPHGKPSRSAAARAFRGLAQYVPTVFTMFQEWGLEGVYQWFSTQVELLKARGRDVYKHEIAENLREDIYDYEEMTASKYYLYSTDDDFDTFRARVVLQKNDYFNHLSGIRWCGDFYNSHKTFMNEQNETEQNKVKQAEFEREITLYDL